MHFDTEIPLSTHCIKWAFFHALAFSAELVLAAALMAFLWSEVSALYFVRTVETISLPNAITCPLSFCP